MKKLSVILFLLLGTAFADCPFSIPCPYDGEPMQNTCNCTGVGSTRACEFAHTKMLVDRSGQAHFVKHSAFAACPQ